MGLFENDVINITNILSVCKAVSSEEAAEAKKKIIYDTNLYSYELIFFVSYEGEVCFGETKLHDYVNSIRFMPKGSHKGNYCVSVDKAGYCIDIYFDTTSPMPDHVISLRNMGALKEKFVKIYNIWKEKDKDYYLNAMRELYDIIKSIRNLQYDYADSTKKMKMENACTYIRKNFNNKEFDYDEMCRESGYASSYFRENFLNIYNMTPTKMLTKIRMEYAEELIITKRYKISQIAEMCGYDNIYYFSNTFKRYFGVSPSKYCL